MKKNLQLMADYNRQMNVHVYEKASSLSEQALIENRGAFFGSILATLNHILVGDIIWLKRFSAQWPLPSLAYLENIEMPQALDVILYSKLSLLTKVRVEVDETLIAFVSALTEPMIDEPLVYKNTKGDGFVKNSGFILQHVFNHQTHHRGQVTALLCQAGVELGATDLLMVIDDE